MLIQIILALVVHQANYSIIYIFYLGLLIKGENKSLKHYYNNKSWEILIKESPASPDALRNSFVPTLLPKFTKD